MEFWFRMVTGLMLLSFLVMMYFVLRKWQREDAAERAKEEEWNRKLAEELPLLKEILNAPDSEYEGMSLSEALKVTREKRKGEV